MGTWAAAAWLALGNLAAQAQGQPSDQESDPVSGDLPAAEGGGPEAPFDDGSDDGDEAARTAAARVLFDEGIEFVDRRELELAEDRFRRALSLRPSPVIAYNLATVLTQRGKLIEASEILRGVLADPRTTAEASAHAQRELDAVLPRIPRLTVRLSGDADDVTVLLDGRILAPAVIGVPAPVDAGSHEVRAEGPDRRPRDEDAPGGATAAAIDRVVLARAQLELYEGTDEEVLLDLPPRQSIGLGAAAQEQSDSSSFLASPWLWVGVGLVVAGATTAVILSQGGEDGAGVVPGNLGTVEIGR